MKDSMLLSLVAFVMTLGIGFLFGAIIMSNYHEERLKGVGIKRIDKFTLESPYVVSNWYSIVWENMGGDDGRKN